MMHSEANLAGPVATASATPQQNVGGFINPNNCNTTVSPTLAQHQLASFLAPTQSILTGLSTASMPRWTPDNPSANPAPNQLFVRPVVYEANLGFTPGSYDFLRQGPINKAFSGNFMGMIASQAPLQLSIPVINMNTPVSDYRPLEPRMAPTSMVRTTTGFDKFGAPLSTVQPLSAPEVVEAAPITADKRADKRRRGDSDSLDSDAESDSSSDPGYRRTQKIKRRHKHAPGQGGTRRLKIEFLSLGEPGEDPQACGRNGSIIPDGLKGRHEMHNQPWEFHITHEKCEGITVVKWSVTNLSSGKTVSVTETPFQAKVRQKTGNTITSLVMRQALQQRVRDLEELLEKPDTKGNVVQSANIQSLIKDLKRKERNEGILFFGLRHEDVQEQQRLFREKEKTADEKKVNQPAPSAQSAVPTSDATSASASTDSSSASGSSLPAQQPHQ